jgi:hypothetical protein
MQSRSVMVVALVGAAIVTLQTGTRTVRASDGHRASAAEGPPQDSSGSAVEETIFLGLTGAAVGGDFMFAQAPGPSTRKRSRGLLRDPRNSAPRSEASLLPQADGLERSWLTASPSRGCGGAAAAARSGRYATLNPPAEAAAGLQNLAQRPEACLEELKPLGAGEVMRVRAHSVRVPARVWTAAGLETGAEDDRDSTHSDLSKQEPTSSDPAPLSEQRTDHEVHLEASSPVAQEET